MNEPLLESQIAKIQMGGNRASANYVFVVAEQALGSSAELFAIIELPLLNPAAESACEKICLSIAGAFKRAYKRPLQNITFENAISQINEELGKLAAIGQTHWINKLNAILAVKQDGVLHISTTGKVLAFLVRNGEFTDIACSSSQVHPLKTFENFASGKIQLNDLVLLSTTQLFNYLSMDRFKKILMENNFLNSVQTIIELLKVNAGPEVIFGTLLNLQVPVGQTADETIDLEDYVVEQEAGKPSLWSKTLNLLKKVFSKKKELRTPQTSLPLVNQNKFEIGLIKTKKLYLTFLKNFAAPKKFTYKNNWSIQRKHFKEFSPEKKFFLVSAIILLFTFCLVLYITIHYKKINSNNAAITLRLNNISQTLNNAQSAFLYQNKIQAKELLSQAMQNFPAQKEIGKSNLETYNKIKLQIESLSLQLENINKVEVENLGTLTKGNILIKLPNMLGAQSDNSFLSYNLLSGQIKDNILFSGQKILSAAFMTKTQVAVFTSDGLAMWDYKTGVSGPGSSLSMPSPQNWAGLALYPTNGRIYLIDKLNNRVVSYLPANNTFTKPLVAIVDANFKNALDLAIDSNIYVLTSNGIFKYAAGNLADFNQPTLSKNISGNAKIFTDKQTKFLYILDPGNNRIIITEKNGNLKQIIISDKFTKLVDFYIDEKNNLIYVLNDSELLKVTIP